MTECDYCGLLFDETFGSDVRQHNKRHKQVETARAEIGFFYIYKEREKIKKIFYQNYPSVSKTEKIDLATIYFQQYFSRSFEGSGFSQKHPCFEEYAGMMLNQNSLKNNFIDIYDDLIKIYKPQTGIEEGTSYFMV
jgi:hypothetical protein